MNELTMITFKENKYHQRKINSFRSSDFDNLDIEYIVKKHHRKEKLKRKQQLKKIIP